MGYAFDISKTIVKKTTFFYGNTNKWWDDQLGGHVPGLKHPGAGLQPVVPNAVRHSHLGQRRHVDFSVFRGASHLEPPKDDQ